MEGNLRLIPVVGVVLGVLGQEVVLEQGFGRARGVVVGEGKQEEVLLQLERLDSDPQVPSMWTHLVPCVPKVTWRLVPVWFHRD